MYTPTLRDPTSLGFPVHARCSKHVGPALRELFYLILLTSPSLSILGTC